MKKIAIILTTLALYAFSSLSGGGNDITDILEIQAENPFVRRIPPGSSPLTDRGFTGFKEAIGFKESQNNYFRINSLGYVGKYQFGASTLALLGIKNTGTFLRNPRLQERAFRRYCRYNKWVLRDEISKYAGKQINGIIITESGILAAAHLAGAGKVRKYLKEQGRGKTIIDAYGTTVDHYLNEFAGYDLSALTPIRNPRL